MLQAMNTGHNGSLTTVHANDPVSCISRLETMFLMGGVDMPVSAIRKQIVEAVDIIVQIQRLANSSDEENHLRNLSSQAWNGR